MERQTSKRGYEAPKIEAAGFMTETGYAASGATQVFNDVQISFGN